jgi:hypothetical protein
MRKSEIIIETREAWIIRYNPRTPQRQQYCPHCAARVLWLSPGDAARLTRQSLRQIFGQLEQEQLHFLETPLGQVLLCLPSLLHVSERLLERGSDEDISAPTKRCD